MQITPESWVAWKSNPSTKAFFQYIEDFREQAAKSIAISLASGCAPNMDLVTEVALRCQIYGDLEGLSFKDIEDFYNPEKEGESNEQNTGA